MPPPGGDGNPIEIVSSPEGDSAVKPGADKEEKTVIPGSPSRGTDIEAVTVVLDTPTSSVKPVSNSG